MEQYDNRVDAYIEKSAEFAKPILIHLRKLVHEASADLCETMKWSAPFFDFKGPVCHLGAFKQHCAFGFWKAELMEDPDKILNQQPDTAGNIGKISSLDDLPADDILIKYIRQALSLNIQGLKVAPKVKSDKPPVATPQYFQDLLDTNAVAGEQFIKLSPSQRGEYISWFEEAKTETTRLKRMNTALKWIAEGKRRNWKYEK